MNSFRLLLSYWKYHCCQTLRFSDDTSPGEVDEPELCQVASDAARLSVVESPYVQSDFCHPLNLESCVTEAAYDHEEIVTNGEAGLDSSVCNGEHSLGNLEQCAFPAGNRWWPTQLLASSPTTRLQGTEVDCRIRHKMSCMQLTWQSLFSRLTSHDWEGCQMSSTQ